jgi:RNA polymerase sigma-70 factor (ECF subfamily)
MHDLTTQLTLLSRLRDWDNFQAWKDLVDRYRPSMVRWAQRRNLSQADAEDVADSVLARLPEALRTFAHDGHKGGFRNYLWQAVHNAIVDLARKRERGGWPAIGGSGVIGRLNQLEDPASVAELEDELGDATAEFSARTQAAVDAVKRRLRGDCTWRAFELRCLEDMSGRQVAEILAIPLAQVHVYVHRVKALLRRELESHSR